MGTLIHDPFFVEMPKFFGMSFDELVAAKHPSAWLDFERGDLSETDFLDRFFADGREFDQKGFVRAVRSAYQWLPGVEAILAELAESGCDMHAFSNYPVWYRLIEERLGLSRFLDWTFVSCLTGLRKPDSPAYVQALSTLGSPAEHCLFIDDRRGNCEAAREHGIQALHFEGVEPLRRSLREARLL